MKKRSLILKLLFARPGKQLHSGKPFTGSEGVFTPLLKHILEASLEGELDAHLSETRKVEKNRRNDHAQKNIRTSRPISRTLMEWNFQMAPLQRLPTGSYPRSRNGRTVLMTYKDLKPCVRDLKKVYNAVNANMALHYLQQAEQTWGDKYKVVFKSWRTHWEKLSRFFDYPPAIRRIIYTTNPIESYHRMVRKVTKTKGAFANEDAIVKQIYLATINANTKWKGQMFGWATVRNELMNYFGERLIKNETLE